jgi:SAM-dependent methyltransferase
MAQITTGVRSILSSPALYNALQDFMGVRKFWRWYVSECIRPFPGMRLLDFGCGPATILDWLPKDVAYVGYDVSETYIASARQRFGERGEFHCRLLTAEEAAGLQPFDLVMANGVLHHLDDAEAEAFLAIGKSLMKPNARFLTLDPCLVRDQNPIARLLISMDRGQNVRDEAGYRKLANRSFEHLSGTVRHRAWIPYTHWLMELTLQSSAAAAPKGARQMPAA